MRNLIRTSYAALALAAETGSLSVGDIVPAAAPEATGIVPNVDTASASNVVAKPARAARKLSGKAVAKPGKAKPEAAAKPVAADAIPRYENRSYNGPSPVFRNHDRKLSPIVLDRVPGSFTDRDLGFLRDLYAAHGGKSFKRANCDAGNLSRAIGAGNVRHVSGSLDQRDCLFALTAAGTKRVAPVSGKPGKA